MTDTKPSLYLVPNLIDGEGLPETALPAAALARIRLLRHYVVEGEKAAWRLLSRVMSREEAALVAIERLDEHTRPEELPRLLEPLRHGFDLGLVSEAGLPCVADPGSALAALAHEEGFRVIPLVGPSSLMLALAASGLDGQRFSFLGYLPQEPDLRKLALRDIDRGVRSDGATRIFIETPYRNDRLLSDCLAVLSPDTRLCVAASLTAADESIRSETVSKWKKKPSTIGKRPAVFLVGRTPGTSLDRPSGFGHSVGAPCKK